MSAPPLISPSSIYSGPPPPYSYPSSTASSVIGGAGSGVGYGNYTSPSETRRTLHEKEALTSVRQSLPSINEALNTGDQQLISISSLLSTTAPPQKLALVTKSPTTPSVDRVWTLCQRDRLIHFLILPIPQRIVRRSHRIDQVGRCTRQVL